MASGRTGPESLPQKGMTLTGQEIGKKYVELCKEGQVETCLETLFAKDAVSVEAGAPRGFDRTAIGLDAIRAKGKWWVGGQSHRPQCGGVWALSPRRSVRRALPL